jgi:hypothetical protein
MNAKQLIDYLRHHLTDRCVKHLTNQNLRTTQYIHNSLYLLSLVDCYIVYRNYPAALQALLNPNVMLEVDGRTLLQKSFRLTRSENREEFAASKTDALAAWDELVERVTSDCSLRDCVMAFLSD